MLPLVAHHPSPQPARSWPAADFFRGFVFPKIVTEAANAVLAALPPFPKPGFAGVHLRIEEDWQPREDREQARTAAATKILLLRG
jgi:hypothetical protein